MVHKLLGDDVPLGSGNLGDVLCCYVVDDCSVYDFICVRFVGLGLVSTHLCGGWNCEFALLPHMRFKKCFPIE